MLPLPPTIPLPFALHKAYGFNLYSSFKSFSVLTVSFSIVALFILESELGKSQRRLPALKKTLSPVLTVLLWMAFWRSPAEWKKKTSLIPQRLLIPRTSCVGRVRIKWFDWFARGSGSPQSQTTRSPAL